jgi:hypothetical protein
MSRGAGRGLRTVACVALAAVLVVPSAEASSTKKTWTAGPVTYVRVQGSAGAGALTSLVAKCPHHEWAVGGGVYATGPFGDAITVNSSTPATNHHGWVGWIQDEGSNAETMWTYVECIAATHAPKYITSQVTVPHGSHGDINAVCPPHTSVIGGGGVISGDFNAHSDLHAEVLQPPDTWLEFANNRGTIDQTLTTTAICTKGHKRYVEANDPEPVAQGTQTSFVVECGKHAVAVSGGTSDNSFDIGFAVNSSRPWDSPDKKGVPEDGWETWLRNGGSSGDIEATPNVVCLPT